MRAPAALLVIVLASCSKPAPPAPYGETQSYLDGKMDNYIKANYFANVPGPTFEGSIDFNVAGLAKKPEEWIETYLNGVLIARTQIYSKPGQRAVSMQYPLTWRSGPNWIHFFSTAQDKWYKFQIDTRWGKNFTFAPDGAGWTMDPPMPP